jgi:hypothetical protein
VIYEMRVWLDKFNEVNKVAATCTPLLNGPHAIGTYLGETGTDGEATNSEPLSCGAGAIAIGITGRSGALIDGVGLKCASFPWHEPATPPVVTPPVPPPTAQSFVAVIADVDVYARPQTPQTAGDQNKGTLSTTDRQVVLKKIGAPDFPNWYQLSWLGSPPDPNWVYSAPPNTGDYTSLDPATLAAAEASLGGGH